ncbi:MAG: restriction endonuclease subunit S [Methanobrevibacter sp.]|uniref:restriction endonuclease subunit S n=1 Tax=Methanobrevibacter sp. TaxID=66852 RepID=UPI002E787DB0|nr:restriction endonuclease subunit S [Methanobrevibacter sp.]MEE0943658.1 restriction endonuclease subunit S [Methanobrevibacter sp.]
MSYNAYDKYKESKIKWIGEIPSTWDTIKAKHCFNLSGGYAFKSDDFIEEGIPLVRIGDITNGTIDFNNCKRLPSEYATIMKEFLVKPGDILIALTGATIGKIGQVPQSNEKILLNQRVGKLSSDASNYYKYILSSDLIKEQIMLIADGSAQENISNEDIGNFEIFDIDDNTKQQIANYLDKKTAKIDTTIAKNKELIQLLEEKRVALINQVVTKGLNPDVPMKDSGVEWIGEIPEHWEIRKFGHMADKIVVGYVGSIGESYTDESGIPLIKTENIQNGKLNLNKLSYVTKEFHLKNKKSQIKSGDILIARHGESGRSCVVPKSLTIANSLNIVILQSGKDMNGYYYSYLLNSSLIQEFMQSIQGGAVQGVVNTEDIAFLKVHVPPKIEQNHIVDFLNQKTSKIDKTISKIQENINLLDEYKTSLIHHVVTGKIDVRGEEI